MTWLYNLGIDIYTISARITAIVNTKAKLWVEGRKELLNLIEKSCENLSESIWVHCPSLGEFEQGRPLIEALRKKYPNIPIVLTFFSPSGYEVRKNYDGVDFVFYLPTDDVLNANRFLNAIKPTLAIFVKYDFWLHYLSALSLRKCPTILVSGIFRPGQHFFNPWFSIGKKMLSCFNHFFVQDKESQQLLKNVNFSNVTISGDTRFDRVVAIKNESAKIETAKIFSDGCFTVVAGSTWPEDEKGIANWINKNENARLIIAQHQISESRISALEKLLTCKNVRFSRATAINVSDARVLIIDNIGMLSSLYCYASVAYVGGGFGSGVHNTLEAAVWQVPIVFGPNHLKFKETRDLIEYGAAYVVNQSEKIASILLYLEKEESIRLGAGLSAKKYVHLNTGATEKIMNWIEQNKVLLKLN